MSYYEDIVMQTQMMYSRYYNLYAAGKTPYPLSERPPLPYQAQIARLVEEIRAADCVVVGGASGLSAAGGGDFYYEDNASYRKCFGKYAEKYHFKGAFDGMMHRSPTREEYWGYLPPSSTPPRRHRCASPIRTWTPCSRARTSLSSPPTRTPSL